MSHHINISPVSGVMYWILHNESANRYVSGVTETGQVTNASDNWHIHMETDDLELWTNECLTLNIPQNL